MDLLAFFGRNFAETELPELPSEVWGHIFMYLKQRDLKRIRRTCHRFKEIVSSYAVLREQFHVCFKNAKMDRSYNPLPVAPASNVSFRRSTLKNIDCWWPSIGVNITNLVLHICTFPLEMLAYTPNLKRLELDDAKHFLMPFAVVDFKLENLEQLTVAGKDYGILEPFSRIITRLNEFHYTAKFNSKNVAAIVDFVRAIRNSLQKLTVYPDEDLLGLLSEISELQLKRVSLHWQKEGHHSEDCCKPELVKLIQAQPEIATLTLKQFCICKNTLLKMAPSLRNLVELHIIRIGVKTSTLSRTVQLMPKLRSVKFSNYNFEDSELVSLVEALRELGFVRTEPSVQETTVEHGCISEQILLDVGQALPKLRRLKMFVTKHLHGPMKTPYFPNTSANFRRLNRGTITETSFVNLEKFHLVGSMDAEVDLFRTFQHSLKLRCLKLIDCRFEDLQLFSLIAQLKQLRSLELS